jgi:hypothetical protein
LNQRAPPELKPNVDNSGTTNEEEEKKRIKMENIKQTVNDHVEKYDLNADPNEDLDSKKRVQRSKILQKTFTDDNTDEDTFSDMEDLSVRKRVHHNLKDLEDLSSKQKVHHRHNTSLPYGKITKTVHRDRHGNILYDNDGNIRYISRGLF